MAVMAQRQKHLAMSQASWAAAHAVPASLKSSFLPSAEADCPEESCFTELGLAALSSLE